MSRRLRSFANRRIHSLQAIVVFASLLLAVSAPACADDAADAIINKGIEALGGEATLAKARATISKVKSTFISGDNASVSKIQQMTDGRGRMVMTVQDDFSDKFMAITVINGDKGWRREGEMEAVELAGQELADQKWGVFWQSVAFTLLELKDSKFKTEAVGDVKVGGKPAAGVKVTGPEGKDFTIYFDTETGLPVKAVADVPDPESPGQEFTQETHYSDYKDFGGIKRATKVEMKRDGETFIKMELLDVKVLDKVEDRMFPAKPDSDRVILLKVVRRLTDKIEQDPTDVLAYLGRGQLRCQLGERDKAIEDYDEAIRLGAKGSKIVLSNAYKFRGWAWDGKGEYDKAIGDYDEAVQLNPKNSGAYIGRGSAWGDKGEWDKALADYDEAIRLDPSSSDARQGRGEAWLAKGEWEKALADYDEAIRLNRGSPEAYLNRGSAWLAKDEYDKALVDYDEAIRLDPNNAEAFVARGNAWGMKGDSEKALADFDSAIRLDPKDSEAHVGRGHAWLDKGEYDRALADFNTAVRLGPKDSEAYVGRGNAWEFMGELEKALADYDEAIRLDPENWHAYIGRGRAWEATGDWNRALFDFDEAIRLDPKNSEIYIARARAWQDAGEWDKSLADLDEAIRLDPKNSVPYGSRGWTWENKDERDKALADYSEAIRLEPNNWEAHIGRGRVWEFKGDFEKALADFDEAIRLDPEICEAYLGRANTWLLKGEYDKSLDDFANALDLDPESITALNGRAWVRATCWKEKFRDAEKALEDANKAGELTEWSDFEVLDTLAAAYAEAAMFDKAAEWQQKAIDLAPEARKEDFRSRLKLYREGKPYRDEPKK